MNPLKQTFLNYDFTVYMLPEDRKNYRESAARIVSAKQLMENSRIPKPKGSRSKYLRKCERIGTMPINPDLYYAQFWFFRQFDNFCVLLSRRDDQFYVSHRNDSTGAHDVGPFAEPKTAAAMCRLMEATYSTFEEFKDATSARHKDTTDQAR